VFVPGEVCVVGIATIFANVSCRDMEVSRPWYEKLFGMPPLRRPSRDVSEGMRGAY
jgi:hypothetical protein